MNEDKTVSVVIPTIGRPELREAVESALVQTRYLHEVVVGADTDEELDLPDDDRVRVVRTGPRAGGNVARMAAIYAATGDLIALLDDDDVWEPDKLERQVEAVLASQSPGCDWISSTRVRESAGRAWPDRVYHGERIPHYLFKKTRIRGGQGAMHTSTLMFPRRLVLEVPFDTSLRFHQDTDWLIRIDKTYPNTRVVQLLEPLTRLREGEGSVSRGIAPEASLAWARRSLEHLDRRTRGDFLLTVTYWQALRHRSSRAKVVLAALVWGKPGPQALTAIVWLPVKSLKAKR